MITGVGNILILRSPVPVMSHSTHESGLSSKEKGRKKELEIDSIFSFLSSYSFFRWAARQSACTPVI